MSALSQPDDKIKALWYPLEVCPACYCFLSVLKEVIEILENRDRMESKVQFCQKGL